MGQTQDMQAMIRRYRDETGESEVDMRKVVRFAVAKGWPLPEPIKPLDRLVRKFSQAARQETRVDSETGQPYRANHVYAATQGGEQYHLWIDIDDAARGPMLKSLQMRRQQMVGDAVMLYNDAEHWNRMNPSEQPIQLEMDFGPDIAWRRNAPDAEEKAS